MLADKLSHGLFLQPGQKWGDDLRAQQTPCVCIKYIPSQTPRYPLTIQSPNINLYLPVSWLSCSQSCCRFVRRPNSCGIFPEILLCRRSSSASDVILDISGGRAPASLFVGRIAFCVMKHAVVSCENARPGVVCSHKTRVCMIDRSQHRPNPVALISSSV